ncbi:MAG TPA: ABC transporter permease [Kouleothrix sp.]|uniref:ABC transporter permease n=1 Tax=Kouleothrix sp. TaxID=2779161 RepID=UPI002B873976|nr:ABC transporter permease [Kouleothrix sp.]HRC75352.1 ABC transporter permease [Kouleothrix sp.]
MNLLESLRVALIALRTNKLRSLLTMLGIIIGVGAVIGMLALGNGFRQYLDTQFDQLGIGSFYIFAGSTDRKVSAQQAPQLTAADAEALALPGAAPATDGVAAQLSRDAQVSAGGKQYTYTVNGVTPSYFSILPKKFGAGKVYSAADERDSTRVVVLGGDVAKKLFGSANDGLGRRITINGVGFEVVGVLDTKRGIGIGGDPGQALFVPYSTARDRLFRNQVLSSKVDVDFLLVKARGRDQIDAAIRQVTQVLRERHRLTYQNNDFTVLNPQQIADQVGGIISGFSAFLGLVAGIALLVGGIGIMNIMLVSVAERTREIGLRKAVGARPRDILFQFLIEAVVLCLIGGAIGIGLGYLFSFGGTFVLLSVFQAEGARATVTLGAILLATAVSSLIGVAFGFFPALTAARLSPITALRSE